MKKLMIAAAIVCAAAISHGAALSWSMSGITATEKGTGAVAGNVAYYMLANTWEDFSKLTADKVGEFCAANYTDTVLTAAGRGGTASITGLTEDKYSGGTDLSGYIVLFDNASATSAGYYAYTEVLTAILPDTGSKTLTTTFATHTGGWQSTAVPEPTSGLLLLLGVAGLALKRRRA